MQNLNVKTDKLTEHSQRHSTPASRTMPFKHKSVWGPFTSPGPGAHGFIICPWSTPIENEWQLVTLSQSVFFYREHVCCSIFPKAKYIICQQTLKMNKLKH